jgi:putative hemolysin
VVRLLGGDPHATSEQLSEEELRELVSTHDALDEQERRILSDVFAATETSVKEVMRPRGDVTFLPGQLSLVEAAERVRDLPYSRYPVSGDGFDDILGFLHVRDLLGVATPDNRRISDVARPVLVLPGSKLVLPSVATMRQEGVHLAVMVDEYGGTDGIVPLEDLVEELVGEIRDEYDSTDDVPSSDPASVDGSTSLEDFAWTTGIQLEDGGYETVAGYVIARLGHVPRGRRTRRGERGRHRSHCPRRQPDHPAGRPPRKGGRPGGPGRRGRPLDWTDVPAAQGPNVSLTHDPDNQEQTSSSPGSSSEPSPA